MIRGLAECIDFMHSAHSPAEIAWTSPTTPEQPAVPALPANHGVGALDPDWVNPRDPALALGPDGKPARSRRAPLWEDVPDEKWNDWRWQLSNRINTLEEVGAGPEPDRRGAAPA